MYEVFYTKPELLTEQEQQVLARRAVPAKMPFFVDDQTLEYPHDINGFLRRLPSQGVNSPITWKAYAYQVAVWVRYIRENMGRNSIWEATREDAESFYRSRRTMDPDTAISASTWNSLVRVLVKLYDYGIEKEHTKTNIFRLHKGFTYNGVPVDEEETTLAEKHSQKDTMRFHSLEEYAFLRDVGFKGMLPDGNKDPDYTPRNDARNTAMVELLVTTGMRISEATVLTLPELEKVEFPEILSNMGTLVLPESITKKNKQRKIFVPKRVLEQVNDYITFEREAAVLRGNKVGSYEGADWIVVSSKDVKLVTLPSGHRRSIAKLSSPTRRKLLFKRKDGLLEPFVLWLSTNGTPLQTSAWTKVFDIATQRCAQHGKTIESYPHKLRHTFAVHMLNFLENSRVGKDKEGTEGVYAGDSLRTVQLLLGHTSVATTYVYLGSVDLMSVLIDKSLLRYVTELGLEE